MSSALAFLSVIISSLTFLCYFISDVLCLVRSAAGSGIHSGVDTGLEILSTFFIGNILLLKLLRTFFCCTNK